MCGIFGVVGDIERSTAARSLEMLAHRGPDGGGLWSGAGITLGHRRLSILDLSDAASQPMADLRGRYHITFNGEIYNFLELRAELEGRGHAFRTDSDTEVILAAFAEWRERCLDRFNGMWAFAIWDAHERALFLARDRFGKKPLFHAAVSGVGFAFASEMKALLPLLPAARPNRRLFRDRGRMFTYEATDECLIEGIARFPAASWGWFRDGRLVTSRWWNTLDHLVEVPRRHEERVELVLETFLDACRLRMRSDVPIGTALSGGLDSSATIASVAEVARERGLERTAGDWQHAFVAGFPGTPLDETPFAQRVCEHIGIEATVVEVDPTAAIPRLLDYLRLFEEHYITSPIPFMLTYGAVKRHGISVTLDGHGADELFGGYGFDFLVAIRDAGLDLAAGRRVLDAYFDSLPPDATQFPVPRSRAWFWLRWQLKDFVKTLLHHNVHPTSRDRGHPAWTRLDSLNRRLYVSTHETILPTLLRNYDRYSMANGVEIRMPFLDHRMVSLAFSLPWDAKVRNGFSKAVVRDAVAPYLPHDIAYRKTKIGFNSPWLDWIRGPLKGFMLDTLASTSFRSCGLIDPRKAAVRLRGVLDAEQPTFEDGQEAWLAIAPYLWEQAFLKGLGMPGAKPQAAAA